jgi:hypothetical protein
MIKFNALWDVLSASGDDIHAATAGDRWESVQGIVVKG